MTNEQLRMQMLSGIITEGEYKAKLQEDKSMDFSAKDQKDWSEKKSRMYDSWANSSNELKDLEDDLKKAKGRDDKEEIKRLNNRIAQKKIAIKTSKEEFKKLNESKDSLNEHYVAGGIVGIGAITQIPSREKTDYEMAFEHFLGERYQLKPNRERDDIKDINEEEDVEEGKEVKVNEYDDFNTESSSVFFSQLANKLKNFLKNEIDLSGIEIDGVEIPEEEHLNDAVEGMMEVLGVVMKGKAYTVGEKEVSPEFLNRFK
jgi:hypothetical protein